MAGKIRPCSRIAAQSCSEGIFSEPCGSYICTASWQLAHMKSPMQIFLFSRTFLVLAMLCAVYTTATAQSADPAAPDSVSIRYYDNGKKMSEVPYKGGLVNGTTIIYYETGEKMCVTHIIKGKAEGLQISYYANGNKEWEIPFSNDLFNGVAVNYSENGAIRAEIPYKTGVRDGVEKQWDDHGTLTTKTWKNGVLMN
jgi:hypothetical protein